ncbi:MAG: xylulokinase [Anaerolineaceae bacterium]|nr:xylulokinase [Anaerolineaceae bacterium]
MAKYLIGIDLGSSSLKALLLDSKGKCLASTSFEYPTASPQPGYSEQDPADWYAALVRALHSLRTETGVDKKEIEGISFSGQMHGLVCANEAGKPLRNAIIWSDQRSAVQVEQILSTIGREKYGLLTGNPLSTGFMLPSWLWIRQYEDKVATKTRFLMLPKDYLRYQMTGFFCSDPSDAASTGLFEVSNKEWSRTLVDAFGLEAGLLPEMRQSHQPAGQVTQTAAEECGLMEGTPVFAGGGDTPVQALGRGIYDEGTLSLAISTGGNLLALSNTPKIDAKLRLHCMNYVIPGRWYNMAATLSAGYSLKWLKENFAPALSYSELADMALEAQSSQDLFFLPHLRGERTPHMDPKCRGVLMGLTAQHQLAHIVRAVMEGVVFSLRTGLETLEELGVDSQSIVVSGGGARHPLWTQLIADTLGSPVRVSSFADAAPLGAAMLAGIGCGVFSDYKEACRGASARVSTEILPDGERSERYARMHQRYRLLYLLVREFYAHDPAF